MKPKIVLALSVSALIIGGASFSRFYSPVKASNSGITAVNQKVDNTTAFQTAAGAYSNAASTTGAATETSLSNTDVIGRQLILDYVDLATSGRATEENINALAERYAESIPTLSKVVSVKTDDIQTESNTLENFKNYDDALTIVLRKYENSIGTAYKQGKNLNTTGAGLYSFASVTSDIYSDTAESIKKIPTPIALVSAHMRLINNYLSSAAAFRALSETEKDPAAAFAGVLALNTNPDQEEAILKEISQILKSNGI